MTDYADRAKGFHHPRPGLGAVGEYQAAGRPWIKLVTVSAAQHDLTNTAANADVGETRVDFPAVTKRVIIRNLSNEDVFLHFASLATTHDGAAAGGANSAVKTTKNYIKIPASTGTLDLGIKCRFFYLSKASAATKNVEIIAELTSIQESYDLNRRGIAGVTT